MWSANLPPFHQQEITAVPFQAGPDLKPDKPLRCRYERQRLFQRRFIIRRFIGCDIKNGVFEDQRIVCPVFFQSARNISMPLSVKGCFASALRTAAGAVTTSAPMSAACLT